MKIQNHYNSYFTAKEQPEVVNIEQATYVSILGNGSPGTDLFYEKKHAIQQFALASSSHYAGTPKAFENNIVEIFYWFDEEETGFVDIGNFYWTVDLALLRYRIVIRIPETITAAEIQTVAEQNPEIPFANEITYFSYTAGLSVQIMHKGPFAGERETLTLLQQFATANQLKKSGMHHEIHLTPFETGQSQAHLYTMLRDPVTSLN